MKTRKTILRIACLVLILLAVITTDTLAEEPSPPPDSFGVILSPPGKYLMAVVPNLPGLQSLPEVVDLSPNLPPVGNQQGQNSCVGWSVAYYYKSYHEGMERGWDLNSSAHQFSPAFLLIFER